MWWQELLENRILITAIIGWFAAQVIKFFLVLLEEKKLNFERLVGSGGMPSSHSSFVTSTTTAVALTQGIGSAAFAVCVVMSLVVMYDASGVRRAAGKQAAILNKLVENFGKEKLEVTGERLKELLGHSPLEVFAGAILGVIIGFIVHYL